MVWSYYEEERVRREEQEKGSELRRFEEAIKRERLEEMRQREKKKKKKNMMFEARNDYYEDVRPRRDDKQETSLLRGNLLLNWVGGLVLTTLQLLSAVEEEDMYEVVHQEVDIRIRYRILHPTESLRYLGLVIHRLVRIDKDVAHHIRSAGRSRKLEGGSGRIENDEVDLWYADFWKHSRRWDDEKDGEDSMFLVVIRYKPGEAFKMDPEGSPPEATYERCKVELLYLKKYKS
ncbi:hypothetical protein Tco_0785232 [Tanacetum coccineum]